MCDRVGLGEANTSHGAGTVKKKKRMSPAGCTLLAVKSFRALSVKPLRSKRPRTSGGEDWSRAGGATLRKNRKTKSIAAF